MAMDVVPSLENFIANLPKTAAAPETSAPEPTEPAKTEEKPTETPVKAAPEPEKKPEPAPPKKDPIAAKFAALARREQEARKAQETAEQSRKALEERERAIADRESRLKTVKRPLEALKELGFSYSDVTQDALGGYKEPEVDPVDAKIKENLSSYDARLKAIEDKEAEIANKWKSLEEREVQAALHEVNGQIKQVVAEGDYEMIRAVGDEAYGIIQETMVEYFKKNQKVLTYQEACDRLEKYYVDYAQKLASTTKIKNSLGLTEKAPAKPQKTAEVKEPSPTLTNALSSATKVTPDTSKMSDEDLLAHLAKKIRYRDR